MTTILIVDDVAANRAVLVALLEYHGYQLLEAAAGSEGLAVARAEHPDLVITDVLMPVMDGYEFVKQLRLDPATACIPVIFYTAHYGGREARALAQAGGVSYVLNKPAESQAVLTIVGRALSAKSTGPGPSDAAPLPPDFDREHLRLLTDKLSEKADDLRTANARLRALINIGLELASERDADRVLQRVCDDACDLFGATYVTLGIVDTTDRTLQRAFTCGTDAANWKPDDALAGILATVVADRRTLRGDNRGGDSAGLQLPILDSQVQAYLAAPVASPSHVYGWICLVGNDGRAFTDDDESLVVALAGQVGRIYENDHFYDVAQKRADELEREMLERRQAERAVRDERDRAQRYLDTAEVFLIALDVTGRITLINRYACSVLGWTADELLGRNWIDTCLPERIRDTFTRTFRTLLGGDLPVVENPVLTRSGAERLIEWRNTVVRDDAGHVLGTFSCGTDITERNQAVEALRTAEERMRFAMEAAGVGIWDMDYTTGVHRWSETLERHYGLQPGTFGGTFEAFVERIHPDDRESVIETVANAMKSGGDFSVQNRTIWPDGTVRWLSGAGRIHFGEHGEPVRAVGITMDVTERRTLEEQFHQAQKMEAIGRLAGGVAHDFNNLLTAILGYCELLLTDLDPGDPRYADVAEIQRAGASAAGLTHQLLAFSRKEIIQPTLLDLNVVVSDMRALLGRLIAEDVQIVLALRPELALVKTDRGQVEQIVMNLALNARDAMPKGGRLTIETANVELDENYPKTHLAVKPGPYVVLTVTDTGTGMTPQVQARLFEPFFTTKEPGKGTGLGLATVHGIVTRNGGSVNVYSEIGRGTSIKVYFPPADAAEMAVDTPPPVARPRVGAETVLVVEDADALRELTRRLLQREGYTVLVAANGDEALRLFARSGSIDLLLTDVVMPGISGSELARRLVEQRPSLKVIYMSGYTEDAIVQHGVLNPGIAFLHKPFTSEMLGRKVREVLDRPLVVELSSEE
jgi:two-component system, cell cycle sensor histidine kinase and response regulator CckA